VIDPQLRRTLVGVLESARELGFLGPGPVEDHLERSFAFEAAWTSIRPDPPPTILDLGTGGGVPGLILALTWPLSRVVLLDGSDRRVEFLHGAIDRLGLADRVRPLAQRAEEAGHSALRGTFSLVTARGFAAPAVTAECGAALLEPAGLLAVAEPPGGNPDRWPVGPLAALGLELAGLTVEPAAIQLLHLVGPFPDRYPRRVGIPSKRPLWS
jgi:16S rRNA (guanine527-N7)-methyltransferase